MIVIYLMVSGLSQKKNYKNMEEFVTNFEKYIDDNHVKGIWKNYFELEEITGIDIRDVNKNVYICNVFIENSKGIFTTRKMYEKYISFFSKLFDAYTYQYK